ncbi:Rieske 2Fe-2S domain-containing protein [Cellulomonas fimi]|uniref:Rieske (2Fe-2S) protein n=1 Tax=Cellulomonas fimi TaxID=1708 RepID=UPI00234DC4FD|nr:Rieske 2Fe-2S domain-containing protein [Cellulomonas fimi]MDC7122008.1 Rieske 2Fe-2S domain-containing protein [Cellulomonas fimi]
MTDGTSEGYRRREVLEAVGVTVAAGVVGFVGMSALAPAEGDDGDYPAPDDGDARDREGGGDEPDAVEGGDASDDGAVLAALSDVPDGGALVLTDRQVVLVRDGDDVEAFSAVCTHQGCLVDEVADGEIRCPCHGSAFDARSGDVVRGPAQRALPEVDVDVRDGRVVLR